MIKSEHGLPNHVALTYRSIHVVYNAEVTSQYAAISAFTVLKHRFEYLSGL